MSIEEDESIEASLTMRAVNKGVLPNSPFRDGIDSTMQLKSKIGQGYSLMEFARFSKGELDAVKY